jgi:tetratricopeptide (TPR) repeat protein
LKLDRNLAAADYNLGCVELEEKQYAQAVDHFTTYTTLRPRDVIGYVKLGSSRLRFALQNSSPIEKRRQLDEAKHDYDLAQSLALTAEACNGLGVIELERNRTPTAAAVKSATKAFETALQYDPKFAPAILNEGIVYDQYLNDRKTALAKYKEYLLLETNAPNSKQVEKLARQVYDELRTTLIPMTRAPESTVPAPGPRSAAPVPGASKVGAAALPAPPAAEVETPPVPSHDSLTASTTPVPPPEPADPKSQSPSQTASSQNPAPTGNSAPEPTTNTVLASPRESPDRTAVATDIHPPNPEPPRKPGAIRTFFRRLNPVNWFDGKANDSSAERAPPPTAEIGRSQTLASPSANAAAATVLETTPHYSPSEPVLKKGDRAEAMRLVNQANAALRQSHPSEAIRGFEEAIKADPTCFEACFSLGMAAMDAKDFSTALDALHQALLIREDSADARYAYAWTLEKKHYYQDAADQLEQMLSQHAQETRGHLLLGNIYAQQLDKPAQARQHYAAVLGLDPNNSQAPALRSWLHDNPGP